MSAAAPVSMLITSTEPHPSVTLWLTAYITATAAGGAVSNPKVSRRRPPFFDVSVRNRHADTSAMRPIGTLT